MELAQILSIKNPFTQEQIDEGFRAWPQTLGTCLARAGTFKALCDHGTTPEIFDEFHILEESVKKLEPLLRDPTDVEKEGYAQVFFKGIPWSGINTIPFALIGLSIYKSYVVPAFGVLMPLITWILPYILLRAFYNIPLTFTEYATLTWRMWNGQILPGGEEPPRDAATQIKTLLQNAWTVFTVGQAMWQPIQQARHFMRLDHDCLNLGNSLIDVKGCSMRVWGVWKRWLPQWFGKWIGHCPDDSRQAFAFTMESPFWLKHVFRALGRLEILIRLSVRGDVVPARFIEGSEPILMLKGFGDPAIPYERRVLSSLKLGGGSKHSILTGPNRGGKSSFLRGVKLNIALAHTFGAAFAESAQMTPFTWIADGMRLNDTPGEQSMFEREVAFGSAVLRKEGGRGLILYDELFHSTNPPDATKTSDIFCNRLWKKENCLSIVSTHVYDLARASPDNVKKLCVAAWKTPAGFKFSYAVRQGICEVSSVELLLKQFQMF